MAEVVDRSDLYAEIREAANQMVQSFCSYPEAVMRLSRLCGASLVVGLPQLPFEKLGTDSAGDPRAVPGRLLSATVQPARPDNQRKSMVSLLESPH